MRNSRVLSIFVAIVLILGIIPATVASAAPFNDIPVASAPDNFEEWEKLKLSYDGAAPKDSHEGTPLGNGYFGAKHNGGVREDVFQLNDKGFWSGDPQYNTAIRNGEAGFDRTDHAKRYEAYQNTRQLLKEAYSQDISTEERQQKIKEVDQASKGMWCASYQATYLPLGNLKLSFPTLGNATSNYQRVLDIDGATSNVSFEENGVTYTRQAFTSHPDRVMVIKLSNDKAESMSVEINMELPQQMVGKSLDNQVQVQESQKEIVMTGRAPIEMPGTWHKDRGITFEARAKAIVKDGTVIAKDNKLLVNDAKEIIIIYSSETSYEDSFTDPSKSSIDVKGNVRTAIDDASEKTYDELLENHQEDYRSLFRRLWINLEGKNIRANATPWDYARHYQYSRYIMIAAERENTGNIPHNLLGIWNYSWNPANQAAYFLNENLQKMHALVGPANLADTSEPLWNWIETISDPRAGGETAKESFGIDDAWVVAHSSDIWAKTDLYGGSTRWANWTSGGIWLMNDLYNAFEYSQDIEFLQEKYRIFEGAVRFALGTLMEVEGVNGELEDYLVIAPSGSPEHWFLDQNRQYLGAPDISTACDVQLYINLFNILEKAASRLLEEGVEVDQDLISQVSETKKRMIPLENYIEESTGRFKEWYNEFTWGEAGHRHASHLLGLYLGYLDINPRQSKSVFEAQKKELQRLVNSGGGGHPDKTFMAVNAGLPSWGLSQLTHGIIGSYDTKSVMQWGPIGASIAETILDSRFEELNILPNLPAEWSSGEIKGIRGRGGYQLSIKWKDNELVECVIDSPTGTTPFVRYNNKGIHLGTDNRFIINRAKTSLEKLVLEANKKLQGPYSISSKNALRDAIATNNYETIATAILNLEPTESLVTVKAEKDQTVLKTVNETLQLTASADDPNAKFFWSVTDQDGKETTAATITQDGILTAKETGVVLVHAMLLDGSGSSGSLEIKLQLAASRSQTIDDRDKQITYTGAWKTHNESKHLNGTVTHSTQYGDSATLAFTGTGIEVISSKAGHLGAMAIEIDGEIVAPAISLFLEDGEYGVSVYENNDLEYGEHTITIRSIENDRGKNRIDLDAFVVYQLENTITTNVLGGEATVTTSPSSSAYYGQEVTVAIQDIEEGKALKEIIVEDRNGQSIPVEVVEELLEVSYQFKMPASEVSITIILDDTAEKSVYDDRDVQITYTGAWTKWNESKHFNGTVTHSTQYGDSATLAFTGTGIEIISSKAGHLGAMTIEIDGEVVAPEISLFLKDGEYGVSVYENKDLEYGEHTITIRSIKNDRDKNRIDLDAFIVYRETGVDKSELVSLLQRAEQEQPADYTEDSWEQLQEAIENAKRVFGDANASQEDVVEAISRLESTLESLAHPERFNIVVMGGTSDKDTAMEGEVVTITAQPAAEGKSFLEWVSEDIILENPQDQTTTFVMPDHSVTITAEYTDLPENEHAIQVINGTANVNSATQGEVIYLTASEIPGKTFMYWTSADIEIEDSTAKETTFIMPEKPVSIMAVFEEIEVPDKTYLLSLSSTAGGEVLLESEGIYEEGSIILLTAIPSQGYRFSHWTSSNGGQFANSLEGITTFQMPASDTHVMASFVPTDQKPSEKEKPSRKKRKSLTTGTSKMDTSPSKKTALSQNTLQHVSEKEAIEKVQIALEAAKKDKSNQVNVMLKNIKEISLDALKSMYSKTSLPVTLKADTMDETGTSVQVRVSIDASKATQSLSLDGYTNSSTAKSIRKHFNRWFKNDMQVLELTQKGDFGQEVNIALKLDKGLSSAETVTIYVYNPEKNSYTVHSTANTMDANGYLHFTTKQGGYYIISKDILQKQ